MDISEGADDQGAGWLLVKKKHRSSSKFSVQNWDGGLSTKQKSSSPRSQRSPPVKLGYSNYNVQPSKGSRDNIVFGPGVSVEDSYHRAASSQKLPQEVDFQFQINNTDVPPKIKWGDLDDGTLLLHQGKSSGGDVKFAGIDSPHLVCRKSEGNDFPYPPTDQKVNNIVGMAVVQDHPLQASHSALANEKSSEDAEVEITDVKIFDPNGLNCNGPLIDKEPRGLETSAQSKESFSSAVADMLLTAAVKHETDALQVPEFSVDVNLKTVGFQPDALSLHPDKVVPGATVMHSPSSEELTCAASEQGVTVQASASCERVCPEVSQVYVVGRDSSVMVIAQDCQLEEPNKTEHGVVADSTISASKGDYKCQQDDVVLDDLTKTQIMDHVNAHGDESKERFRERLWCFLFENLNRAIDELYLLCELECDLEQMKEGILVLEEAASDFRELNARVEEFEKVKKSSSHVFEGAPLAMKSDHRRPHALSWEVRRMTTSPRRAEILSSSLEAFRKIQQERASACAGDAKLMGPDYRSGHCGSSNVVDKSNGKRDNMESMAKPRKQQHIVPDLCQGKEEKNVDSNRCGYGSSKLTLKECSAAAFTGKNKRDLLSATSDSVKQPLKREKVSIETVNEKSTKSLDNGKRQISFSEKEKEKRNGNLWRSMDAWKEKRNWEDILAPPHRISSRFSHSPGMSRKSSERARTLHDKLMSPDKRKKSVVDLKKEAEEKHARAMRIRNELESERVQRLQRTSEKLNRVSEFQAERNMKLREVMHARHRRGELRHEAFLAQVVRRANDESSKVNEVRFITSLNEENKKFMWRQKIHDSELRMAEKRQLLKTKHKEDMAREEAVLERKRLLEAEKLQRIAEMQRKKEEAQVRREEERKASSAAREAKAMEQIRRKEVRAKAQQEEAELLAQKLAERLSESEQRRKFYLEQIRERASMDYRDQTSPFLRRSVNKEGQGRSTPNSNIEDSQVNNNGSLGGANLPASNMALQHSLKRRIKRIRQKLMALKHEYSEPSIGAEVARIGYRATAGTARAKIGRWLQELQKLRQARKEGAINFGLITAEMIKFLEGRDAELHASRQAGLLDFIASALPASHTSKPEACQVTLYLLRLLKVVLTMPANRSYFLSQNLLPPIIPMLAAALENYIKIAASVNAPGLSNLTSGKSSIDNLEMISETLDGFLWIVAAILGHICSDERQIQMQDGLLELVIAYQVIQHLRDLFALYDRPQVEGSPFPSSIILSIKLLKVMTFRFRNFCSIDSESFPAEITSANGSEGVTVAEVEDLKGLPDVTEDRPLDESLQMKNSDEVECTHPKMENADVKDESPSIPCSDVTKGFVSLKGDEKSSDKVQDEKEVRMGLKQPVPYLLSVVSETGLVCLPSMLTAVLLQANNRLSEQISYILPTNFDEVATGVLKVLNNLALIDVIFIQRMLARPDLKMEFFHLMGFLLSHCTSKWGVATDQVGLLLLESLSLLGYFALFHPQNQAVLRWGKSPTILHKVCDLPFVFFSDPELMPVLAGTLIAACFGCDQNRSVILQELSMDMLLSLLKSCKNSLSPSVQSVSVVVDNQQPPLDETSESNQSVAESRKLQVDGPTSQKSHRFSTRNARTLSQKVAVSSNNTKSMKMRNQRENKVSKVSEEMGHKKNQYMAETSGLMLMLYNRFPQSFIDRAEHFFSINSCSLTDDI